MTRSATTPYVAAEAQGKDTQQMTAAEASVIVQTLREFKSATNRPSSFNCPFTRSLPKCCTKAQPICSVVRADSPSAGELVAVCPSRLALTVADLRKLSAYVGLVGDDDPAPLRLASEVSLPNDSGRIDYVLINEATEDWFALEVQTVYTSGGTITEDLRGPTADAAASASPPFVINAGHPDFRSSGPKRLVPQLYDKAPSIRDLKRPIIVLVDAWWYSQCAPLKETLDKRADANTSFQRGTHEVVWAVADLPRGQMARLRLVAPMTLDETRSALQQTSSLAASAVLGAIVKRIEKAGETI